MDVAVEIKSSSVGVASKWEEVVALQGSANTKGKGLSTETDTNSQGERAVKDQGASSTGRSSASKICKK